MDIVSMYIFFLKMFDTNSSILCDVDKISRNIHSIKHKYILINYVYHVHVSIIWLTSILMNAWVGWVINEIITEINIILYRINDMMTYMSSHIYYMFSIFMWCNLNIIAFLLNVSGTLVKQTQPSRHDHIHHLLNPSRHWLTSQVEWDNIRGLDGWCQDGHAPLVYQEPHCNTNYQYIVYIISYNIMNASLEFIVQTAPVWVNMLILNSSHTLPWMSNPPPLSLKWWGRQQQCPVKNASVW